MSLISRLTLKVILRLLLAVKQQIMRGALISKHLCRFFDKICCHYHDLYMSDTEVTNGPITQAIMSVCEHVSVCNTKIINNYHTYIIILILIRYVVILYTY